MTIGPSKERSQHPVAEHTTVATRYLAKPSVGNDNTNSGTVMLTAYYPTVVPAIRATQCKLLTQWCYITVTQPSASA